MGCLANELVKHGYHCSVAVPENKASIAHLSSVGFHPVTFEEALAYGGGFEDGRGPDLVHVWTPREIVRCFCDQVIAKYECPYFVHMEDNEWHILSCFLGTPFHRLALQSTEELDRVVTRGLSHPHRARDFLAKAEGVTVIIDRLSELVPAGKPVLELWPSADESVFWPRPKRMVKRQMLGIPLNSTVIVYTGNAHAANAHEMRSLYLAVGLLNREGHPTTLVRAGRDHCAFLGEDERWGRQHSIELGLVSHNEIPELLALADVLVQPGVADEFNEYRFPSKLPEFLSAGRPVIVPQTNIGKRMTHGEHAYVLSECSGIAIADAVRAIVADAALADRLSSGAVKFFSEHLSWAKSAANLRDFYHHALQRSAKSVDPPTSTRASLAAC